MAISVHLLEAFEWEYTRALARTSTFVTETTLCGGNLHNIDNICINRR